MLKSDRAYKIFMTVMIIAIAIMLLAMGIISLQKNLKANLTITINPNYEYRIDYKLDSQEDFLPMFCNTEKDSLGVFVGEKFSLNGAILTATNLMTENQNISFRIYNYTPKPVDANFTHLKMSAGGENMGVAEFAVYVNPYESSTPTPSQTTITANASNISIKFKFEWATMPYTVTTEPSSGNYQFVGIGGASNEFDYTANILPANGYMLEMTITSSTTTLTKDTDYTYDETTGVLVINQSSITGNIVITCTTSIREYTITYELFGGTLADGVNNPTTYTAETESFTISNPSREDATFLGWLVNDSETPVAELVIPKGSFGDLSIEAKYDIDFVYIDYNATYYDSPIDTWDTTFTINRTLDSKGIEIVEFGVEYFVTITAINNCFVNALTLTGIETGGYTTTLNNQVNGVSTLEITDWSKVTGNKITILVGAGGQTCLLPDTLVMFGDGTMKEIQYATYEDEFVCWDFFNGCYTTALPVIIFDCGFDYYDVIHLKFSDGTTISIAGYHMFLEADTKEWINLTPICVNNYIGHDFVKVEDVALNTYSIVTLVEAEIEIMYTRPMSIMTAEHFNFIANDMFNMSILYGETEKLFCVFDIKENMMYDQAEINADIANYGLFTYEEWSAYATEWQFYALGGPYMKIPVMKGISSIEYIFSLLWHIPTP